MRKKFVTFLLVLALVLQTTAGSAPALATEYEPIECEEEINLAVPEYESVEVEVEEEINVEAVETETETIEPLSSDWTPAQVEEWEQRSSELWTAYEAENARLSVLIGDRAGSVFHALQNLWIFGQTACSNRQGELRVLTEAERDYVNGINAQRTAYLIARNDLTDEVREGTISFDDAIASLYDIHDSLMDSLLYAYNTILAFRQCPPLDGDTLPGPEEGDENGDDGSDNGSNGSNGTDGEVDDESEDGERLPQTGVGASTLFGGLGLVGLGSVLHYAKVKKQ